MWRHQEEEFFFRNHREDEEPKMDGGRSSMAAPVIFFIVSVLQLTTRYLHHIKKNGAISAEEIELRREIKKLLKEAASLSQPSTFAQAAKLRRMAAAKEKKLLKSQELHGKEIQSSYDSYVKVLVVVKWFTYFVLVCWFWRVPVAAVSKPLMQPFGRILSWKSGEPDNDNVMVGIMPWLIISNRVSRYVCQKFFK
ncbi:Get1 family [Dillenia turbinata]|uniref:Get1 family n=1 Tax=Dillenia turbinata TaxID=194707 RepID=A0AAN8Z6N0_9MAGN